MQQRWKTNKRQQTSSILADYRYCCFFLFRFLPINLILSCGCSHSMQKHSYCIPVSEVYIQELRLFYKRGQSVEPALGHSWKYRVDSWYRCKLHSDETSQSKMQHISLLCFISYHICVGKDWDCLTCRCKFDKFKCCSREQHQVHAKAKAFFVWIPVLTW